MKRVTVQDNGFKGNTAQRVLLSILVGLAFSFILNHSAAHAAAELPELPSQLHYKDISLSSDASITQIQSAINEASSSGGGTVTLAAGVYSVTESIYLKSNVTIEGAGKGMTILRIEAENLGSRGALTSDNSSPAVNVIIRDLTVDGIAPTDPDDNTSTAVPNYGILLDGGSYVNDKVLFDRIEVKNTDGGLHLKGASNVTIQNSEFYNNGGSYYYWHNVYLRRVSKVLIYNCEMYDAISANGINISYSNHITIDSSNIYNNYFRGIRAAVSEQIDITNNTVSDSGNGDGIILISENSMGVNGFNITNNTVSNNQGYGILVHSDSSNGEIRSNVDGGGNLGFILNMGSNVTIE